MTLENSNSGENTGLYVVATPIGNLKDFSTRAVEVLSTVDLIAAEDTRHSARLLQEYSVTTPLVSFHDYSSDRKLDALLDRLTEGQSIALISDAGTPAISDPGYELVREARLRGIKVSPVPGPSALLAALSVSGLPSDRFIYEGFLPTKSQARKQYLRGLKDESGSLILFESPRRIVSLLGDIVDIFGSEREVFIGRELTKKFETTWLDTAENCLAKLTSEARQQKGEFVLVVSGQAKLDVDQAKQKEGLRVLEILLTDLSLKQAAQLAAKISGAGKNQLYEAALASKNRTTD